MLVKEIYPSLFLYIFSNQFELCSTFFRLQEFYESPIRKIRGKYFTYEDFVNEHAYLKTKRNKKVEFTYFSDWDGFNVPGSIVKKFILLFKDDLTNKEKCLLNRLEIYNNFKQGRFYLIGVVKGEEETMKHEIAHGFYYLNKAYKKDMNKLIKALPKRIKDKIKKELLKIGYCKQVIKDETQAYLSIGIRDGMIGVWNCIFYWKLIKEFNKTFEKYYAEIK